MFKELKEYFDLLMSKDQGKLEAGHYPTCKEARYCLQQMKLECQVLREKIIANYHDGVERKKNKSK